MSSPFTNLLFIVFLLVSYVLAQQDVTVSMPSPVNAGSAVTITWSSSTSETFAILLKQGDYSTTNNWVISVLAQSGIANTGSFTWTMDQSLPSGSNYYIRVQTGAASDWNGGLGGAPPTSDGVYGISNYFTLISTVPTTSYTNPTRSVAPPTSTSSQSTSSSITSSITSSPPSGSILVPVTSSSSSTSNTPTASPKSSKTSAGVIAGSVVGSVIGVALLAALLAALANAINSKPPGPGAHASKDHDFFFIPLLPKGEKLDPAQITLTLTPKERPNEHKYEPVAWQVFNVDNSKDQFQASLPYDLGFGSVTMDEGRDAIKQVSMVTSSTFDFAPPGWPLTMKHSGNALVFEKATKRSPIAKDRILIKNESMGARQIAIGSYHKGRDMEDPARLQPFLVVGEIPFDNEFSAHHQLILHAYQTRDVEVGQVITESIIEESNALFDENGKEVAKLPRKSTWHVQPNGPGKIKLVFGEQKQKKWRFC